VTEVGPGRRKAADLLGPGAGAGRWRWS